MIETREDAMVQAMLEGRFALCVLGGSHDLTENIDRLSGGMCEYIVVTTKAYNEIAPKE